MRQNTLKDVIAFKVNLDFVIEDFMLEEDGIAIELYLDAADLYETVLGFEAFYRPGRGFDSAKFEDKRALVHSLVASGWIGQCRLLPPHMTEMLTMVNLHFSAGIDRNPETPIRQFLEDIRISHAKTLSDVSFDALSKDQSYDFIKEEAAHAETWFKLSQCMVPSFKRMQRLLEQEILPKAKPTIDLERVAGSEYFQRLAHSFARKRPYLSHNNVADAAAVAILIDMVNDYRVGRSKTIPRFFVPSHLFPDAIDGAGVAPMLSYQNPSGTVSSVLRGPDYYVLKASFLQRKRFRATPMNELNDSASKEYLRALSKTISSIIESHVPLPPDALEKIDFYGQPLGEAMRELQMLSFLQRVWLKFEAPDEMRQTIAWVGEAAREIGQSETFHVRVQEAIDELEKRIGEGATEFRWLSTIWTRLENAAEKLRSRVDINTFTLPGFFRELGLLRYGFPETANESIRNVLQELLRGETAEEDARVSVITACYRGRKNPSMNIDSLVMGVAVLLVAKMDSDLLWLLNKINPLPHTSLKMVLAEMLLKSDPKSGRAAGLLKQLEREYAKARVDSRKRADLAVGIAYLYVRLWRVRGGRAKWNKNQDLGSDNQDELRQLYLDKAISSAQGAYRLIKNDPMKKMYALNQYLYYMVEGGGDDRVSEMGQAAENLAEFRNNLDLWQYRFDDTLARYFYRLAIIAQTEERWTQMIRIAQAHSDRALSKSHGDPEVEHFSTCLSVTIGRGYSDLK